MKNNRVFIFVSGGLVQLVKADDPGLQVFVADWDNVEREPEKSECRAEYARLEKESANLPVIN